MYAVMHIKARMMAFALAPLDRCRIVYTDMWIGNASFDLSATEMDRVKAAYPNLRDATPVDKQAGIG